MIDLFYFSAFIIALSTIFALVFIIGFQMIGGSKVTFNYLNHSLAMRKTRLNILSLFSFLTIACWLVLFLPFADVIFDLHYLTEYSYIDGLIFLGEYKVNDTMGRYYFIYLMFTILTLKFAMKTLEIIPILRRREVSVRKAGILLLVE